jgi:phage portal protein BeeE
MNWNIFNFNKKEERANPLESVNVLENSLPLTFGKINNSYAAMNLPTVFRCVDLISDSVAMLPIKNFDYTFGNQTKYEFMKLLIQSVLIKGNGFALIGKNKSLRFLNSNDVQIVYDKLNPAALYYTCNLIPNKRIYPNEIIHLKKFSFDGVNGKSVIDFGIRSIKIAHASENSALGLFENGCNLAGVLNVEGQVSRD